MFVLIYTILCSPLRISLCHVSKNRPEDLKIVTTSYLGNFTLGITAFTKCVHVFSGIDR